MVEIDYYTLGDANKGLVVAFIFGTIHLNVLLIKKVNNNTQSESKSKRMILISLAIGEIVMALQHLVLGSRFYFKDPDFIAECSLYFPARVYQNYLIHFVHALGLATLAVELMVRYKFLTIPFEIDPLLYSVLPWIIGFMVVTPLTMGGMDWGMCVPGEIYNTWPILFPFVTAAIVFLAIWLIRLDLPEQNYGEERATLRWICMIFFSCVIPYSVCVLLYQWDQDSSSSGPSNLIKIFFWLSKGRSVITPLIWICTSSHRPTFPRMESKPFTYFLIIFCYCFVCLIVGGL